MIHSIKTFLVVVLRTLAGMQGHWLFRQLERLDLDAGRRRRLYSYIFDDHQLRTFQDWKQYGDDRVRTLDLGPKLTGRQRAASVGILLLRGLNKVGLAVISSAILRVLSAAGTDPVRVQSLYVRVFGDDSARKMAQQSHTLRVADIVEGRTKARSDTEQHLAGFQTINLFLEPGATLPDWVGSRTFSSSHFVVYAFGDVSEEITRAGIADRTEQASLRDRFNDISPEGEALFRQSEEFSRDLIAALGERLPLTGLAESGGIDSRLFIAFRDALDAALATRLSLLECYRAALQGIPQGELCVLSVNGADYLLADWAESGGSRPPEEIAIHFAVPSQAAAKALAMRVYAVVLGLPRNPPSRLRQSSTLAERWAAFTQGIETGVESFASSLSPALTGHRTAIVIHAESAMPYQQTLRVIGEALSGGDHDFDAVTFLHAALSREVRVLPRLLSEDRDSGPDLTATDMGRLDRLIRPYVTNAYDLEAIAYELLNAVELSGRSGSAAVLMEPVVRFLRRDLPWIALAYRLGVRIANDIRPSVIFASTSRHWMSRALLAGILEADEVSTCPIIDVQTLNVLDHPKYKAPMATHLTVIDAGARDIHRRAFGFNDDRIRLVGAPPNQLMMDALTAIDSAQVRAGLEIVSDAQVITLISQLQPMERMLHIARPMATLAREDGAMIIIRLHPREDDARQAAYQSAFEAMGVADRLRFSRREETPAEILSISDACVTIYSNMAREAALMDIPVICAEFSDWSPPISLAAEGLASPAATAEALVDLLRSHLKADGQESVRAPYLAANPHLLASRPGDAILDYASELMTPVQTHRHETPAQAGRPSAGPSSLASFKRAHLICAGDVRLRDMPAAFPHGLDLTVYASDVSGDTGSLPRNATVIDGRYAAGEDERLADIVTRANALTDQLCADLAEWAAPIGDLSSHLSRLRQPLWLRMRPTAIRGIGDVALRERGIESCPDDSALILHSNHADVLRHMADTALAKADGSGKPAHMIFVLLIRDDLSHELLEARQYLTRVSTDKSNDGATPLVAVPSESLIEKSATALERWLDTIERLPLLPDNKPRLLVTTDWRLKTVPPTLAPVLEAQLERGVQVTLANIADRDSDAIMTALGGAGLAYKDVTSPAALVETYPQPAPRVVKRLALAAQARLSEELDDPEIVRLVRRMVDGFVRTQLVELLVWDHYCRGLMAGKHGTSLACPGRQWHAQVAHDAADAKGHLSLTLQNSYMTAGYTYTPPTGQYITAIDAWSRDLYEREFGIDPERIHVTSTPRFDYLAGLQSLSKDAARADIGVSPDDAIVLFAAQDRFAEDAHAIIAELAKLSTVNGRPVRVIAKLHPRTPPDDIAAYRATADAVNASHPVEVVSDMRIATYLAACDVAITMFSNVGTEAAILGRNLIVANLTGTPLPLPMDEFDIGHVVTQAEDLAPSVERFFTDPDFARAQAERTERFRAANPHMVKGTSTQAIDTVLREALSRKA